VDQNRDGQMAAIFKAELPNYVTKYHSILHYDGMPLDADTVFEQVVAREKAWT
jgi:hypothetical protein